ncbi:MAG: F0F1 ATP synthase subunit B [Pseudomonadales bacterium]
MNINLTLFAQLISFAIFVWICRKHVWPPIIEAMEARQKEIADGLSAAERAQNDLQLAQNSAADKLRDAKVEASGIIEAANKRASQIVDEAKDQARVEGDRIKEAAQAEIDQEYNRAREDLRAKVATLAVTGAEKILQSSVDQSAHQQMLDKLAADL